MENQELFINEIDINELDEEIVGGKYSKAQCRMLWLNCLTSQIIGECGGYDTAACELYANKC